nr:immunoglobulin heavy chain junction region [Macaca mulatta]
CASGPSGSWNDWYLDIW